MSDEEEDYMSSSFLEQQTDVRPGLMPKSARRRADAEERRPPKRSRRELEEESRAAGLDAALGPDNRGFAMLRKMGYVPGQRLGPAGGEPAAGRRPGLSEPIRVEVKADRLGLGREQELRRRIGQRAERRRAESTELAVQFRQRMRGRAEDRRLAGELRRCRVACEQLDSAVGVEDPVRPWFWLTTARREEEDEEDADEEGEEEEEEDDLTAEEMIGFICEYIRSKYFYCFWCAIRFESESDMDSNCPGPDKDSHEDELSS